MTDLSTREARLAEAKRQVEAHARKAKWHRIRTILIGPVAEIAQLVAAGLAARELTHSSEGMVLVVCGLAYLRAGMSK